jgi:hypothetical protein
MQPIGERPAGGSQQRRCGMRGARPYGLASRNVAPARLNGAYETSAPGRPPSRSDISPVQPRGGEQTTQINPRFHSNTRSEPDAIRLAANLIAEQIGQGSRTTPGWSRRSSIRTPLGHARGRSSPLTPVSRHHLAIMETSVSTACRRRYGRKAGDHVCSWCFIRRPGGGTPGSHRRARRRSTARGSRCRSRVHTHGR